MQIQRGVKKDSSLTKFVLGAHPIIEHFIEMLQIREIIGTYVRTDKRMRLDAGQVLTLLIHNILTTPHPLYEMQDWLKPLDPEKVGLKPEQTKWIQDDRIGRALARFYDSRHKDVFFRLALRAIKIFSLDCGRIHHDTTSVTFVGKYAGWSAKEWLTYRLHWIRSTQKAEQDAETRTREIHRALEELRKIQTQLNTYNLKQRKQIVQRVEGILKKERCQTRISYEIHATREYKRTYQRRGRPTKDSPSQITWKQVFSISFGIDKDAVSEEEKTDGVFPLITNLDSKTYPAKKTLEIYKFQPFLEKRHSQIKTYQEIAPVHLKKAERVVAFLHMHVMALMVASLIERKLRLAMRKKRIPSLPIYPENRPCKSPTIFDIVRLFRNVERYEVTVGDDTMIFPAELTGVQKEVLNLWDVSVALYQ